MFHSNHILKLNMNTTTRQKRKIIKFLMVKNVFKIYIRRFSEKNTSDWDLLAYAQLDLFSFIGDYAYAYTSNFTHSLATSVPEEYPVALNNSFYLQIDGGFYFRWTTTIDNVTSSKSAIDEEIFWTSWISVETYINEFFYDIFYDGEFSVRIVLFSDYHFYSVY